MVEKIKSTLEGIKSEVEETKSGVEAIKSGVEVTKCKALLLIMTDISKVITRKECQAY